MSNIKPFKQKLVKRKTPLSKEESQALFDYYVKLAHDNARDAALRAYVDEDKINQPIVYAPPRTTYLLDNNIK